MKVPMISIGFKPWNPFSLRSEVYFLGNRTNELIKEHNNLVDALNEALKRIGDLEKIISDMSNSKSQ